MLWLAATTEYGLGVSGSELFTGFGGTGLEQNRCTLWGGVGLAECGCVVIFALECDLVDFIWVICSFLGSPWLEFIFPGPFPESGDRGFD